MSGKTRIITADDIATAKVTGQQRIRIPDLVWNDIPGAKNGENLIFLRTGEGWVICKDTKNRTRDDVGRPEDTTSPPLPNPIAGELRKPPEASLVEKSEEDKELPSEETAIAMDDARRDYAEPVDLDKDLYEQLNETREELRREANPKRKPASPRVTDSTQ